MNLFQGLPALNPAIEKDNGFGGFRSVCDTLVLVAIWIITRIPDNPITGRGGMINEMGIAVEVMEWAFVGLTAGIIAFESKRKRLDKKNAELPPNFSLFCIFCLPLLVLGPAYYLSIWE